MSARVAPDDGHDGQHRRGRRRRAAPTRAGSRGTSLRVELREHLPACRRMPSTTSRACSTISGGPSSERTPTRHRVAPARPRRPARRARSKASRSVTSSPAYSAHARPAPARAAPGRRGPCRSAPAAGSRAPCAPSGSHRPSASASRGDPPHERVGGLLVGRAAPVEASRSGPCPRSARAARAAPGCRARARTPGPRGTEAGEVRHHARLGSCRARAARRRASRRTRSRPRRPAGARRPPRGPRCRPRSA